MDPLRALVTSEARARVLTALFIDRGRSYYKAELAQKTALPLMAVQRELRRMVDAGIVRSQPLAGRTMYTAAEDSAIYPEIRGIVAKLRGPARRLQDALAGARGVELAWIFGSVADGTATASSDVDVMVLGAARPRSVRSLLLPPERELGRSLNEHVISVREWSARLAKRDPFLTNVRQGVKLWIKGGDDRLRDLDPGPRRE